MPVARSDWDRLAGSLEGALVLPGDPGYAWARKRFVAHHEDVLPEAMARCASAEDVAAALMFARSRQLPFALRSGGHSYADHSSTNGILIELARLDSVTVDGDTVVVGAGATVGRVAEHLAAHGRVLPCGSWPTVGMAGIALAGGYGFLGRMYGLTTDHLLGAQVVLADGSVTTADSTRHPRLHWALLGAGGGSLGVVTSLVFRTHPARPMTSFYSAWPLRHAAAVIDRWQHWGPGLPDEVTAELSLTAPDFDDEPPTVAVFGGSLLDRAATAGLLADLARETGVPAERTVVRTLTGADAARYQAGLVSRDNDVACIPPGPFERPGFQFVKSEFFSHPLPADVVALIVEHVSANRSHGERRDLEFVPWRGAYGRVPAEATAFVHRQPHFLLRHTVLLGSSATTERRRAARRWVTDSWATAHPYGSGHVYQGFPDIDLADWAHAYYGANLGALRNVKAAYDPGNVFRFAQSITPGDAT